MSSFGFQDEDPKNNLDVIMEKAEEEEKISPNRICKKAAKDLDPNGADLNFDSEETRMMKELNGDDTLKMLGTIGQMNTKQLTDILFVEQNPEDRKFNINDIKGDCEVDPETGKVANAKKDSFGNLPDKEGR